MKLTNYGKRFMMTAGANLCAIVFLIGGVVCLFDLAWRVGVNQQAYNVLFIMAIMPVCVLTGKELLNNLMSHE